MFATTRSSIGRVAATTLIALPFAVTACVSKDEAEAIAAAEARTVESDVRITPVAGTAPAVGLVGGTGVSTVRTYGAAVDAYNAGSYREAAEMYKVHLGAKPDDAHAHYMLGLSSWKAGDFTGANEALDKAIELNPKFAKGYFNKARVLLDLKRAPEALEVIDKGRGIDSTSSDGWRLKARAQAEGGDVEGAMKTYRELLVRDDADPWGLNNLGVLLLDNGKFEEALGPLARAVQVKPTAPLFQNNFGMALERNGHRVAALRHYEEAVRNDSTFAKAVRNAERLRGIVTDSTRKEEVSEPKLAEEFRQKVKAWKDGIPTGDAKPPEPR